MIEILTHTLIDSVKILPFLFIAYLIMEFIEHKTTENTKEYIKKSGKFGPVIGGILGAFPQCGFSVTATNLYAGRIITLGTLMAVYLSTSDEMLPIFISQGVAIDVILKILGIKVLIGVVAGFIIDFVLRKKEKEKQEDKINQICQEEHCCCEEGILKSAIKHTLNIFLFIVIVTLILNIVIHLIGEETLSNFILNKPILGPIIAGLIGLIPNCASSVILTELYLSNIITVGTAIGGLLVGAGVGLLVLFRVNKNVKENIFITITLYGIGVISAIILNLIGITI